MKPSIHRRIRRRPVSRDIVAPKKDNQQDQQFFGETTHEPFFKPAVINQDTVKCKEEKKEEKKVSRSPDKKEEEKKVQRAPDKKEEEKLKKKEDKKDEDKVKRLPGEKEEKKVQRAPDKKEEEKLKKKEDRKEEKTVQKMEEKKEEEKVKKKEGTAAGSNTTSTASGYVSSINGKGQSLDSGVQSFYESRLGTDLSDVKIHTGKEAEESAKDINAQAYAYGNHIVFNEGKYQPGSGEGKHLLAHELVHVMQNKGEASSLMRFPEVETIPHNIVLDNAYVDNTMSNGHYRLRNNSDKQIAIHQLYITGSPYFNIELTGNNIVEPNSETTFSISFAPGQAGLSEGTINIIAQDGEEYSFPVSGQGTIIVLGPDAPPAVVEEPKEPEVPGKAPSKKNLKAYGAYLEKRVEHVEFMAHRSYVSANNSIKNGIEYNYNTIEELNKVCELYSQAYANVESVIKRGEGNLADAKFFSDLALSLAIGVGTGLTMGAFFPLASGASLSATVISEINIEIAESAVSQAIKGATAGSGSGTEGFLKKANPLLKTLDVYKTADNVDRGLAVLGTELLPIETLVHLCGPIGRDCREFAVSGKHKSMDIDALEARVTKLERGQDKVAEVLSNVRGAVSAIESAYIEAQHAAKTANVKDMEYHLWLQWISQLKGDEKDLIHSDPVESALNLMGIMGDDNNPYSKIGWNVGWYVSDDNQDEGVQLSKLYVMALSMIGKTAKITKNDILYNIEFEGLPWYKSSWLLNSDDNYLPIGQEMLITGIQSDSLLEGKPILLGHPINKKP